MVLDVNFLRIVVTVIFFTAFVGIVMWAYSSRNKAQFEEAALLPFNEETIKTGKVF